MIRPTQIRSYGTQRSARMAKGAVVLYACLAVLAVVLVLVGAVWSAYD
jgi:hypothetical protein